MPKRASFPCPPRCNKSLWATTTNNLWNVKTSIEKKRQLKVFFKHNTDLTKYTDAQLKLYHSWEMDRAMNRHYRKCDDVDVELPAADAQLPSAASITELQQQLEAANAKIAEQDALLAAANAQIAELRSQLPPKPKPKPRKPVAGDMVFIKPYEGNDNMLAQILHLERDGSYMVATHEHGEESLPFHIPASDVVCFARLNPPVGS
jgi:hypothetical protein